jgi:tetratricopeptide (TPR) repeat protein
MRALRYRSGVLIALVLAALLAGRTAHAADPKTEKAREHYLQGDAFYKLDKYADALHEYEQAYIAKPDPSFLYNIAQCHRLMGDRADALRFYRRYLKDAPGAPNRAIAEKHIRELEAALAHGPDPGGPPAHGGDTMATPAQLQQPPAPPPPPTSAPPAMPPPTATPLSPPVPNLALASGPSDTRPPSALTVENSGATTTEQEDHHPFYTRWWFWTAVGVVVVGTVLIAASAPHDPSCPPGSTCK